MTREEVEQYEQDRLGNVRRKLDELRAQGGQVASNREGFVEVKSNRTGTDVIVYSQTAGVDEAIILEIVAHNSAPSGSNTIHLVEGPTDANNAGQISNSTRRSVDYVVEASDHTKRIEYHGKEFTENIGVNAEFAGQVAVGVVEVREEETEPNTEDTSTP